MRKLKSMLAFTTVVCLCASCFPINRQIQPDLKSILASAEDVATSGTCGENLTWAFDEPTGTLTISGTGDMTDSFWNNQNIKAVIMEEGVTTICDDAFNACRALESVIIPNSVTKIGSNAFASCEVLTSVTIPNTITAIGEKAFWNSGLESVTIPDSITQIEEMSFASCKNLASVKIPDSVTTIGNYAFNSCTALTSIDIPDSVAIIGKSAFRDSALESVSISDNITTIDVDAFECLIHVSENNPNYSSQDGILFDKTKTTLLRFPKNSNMTDYVIPDSVTIINDSAFGRCFTLQSVTILESVTAINTQAFEYCENLKSVIIPDSVTTIGTGAFYNCSGLQSVTLPDTITEINAQTFDYCLALKSITIPDSVTKIDFCAFYSCYGLESITIENPECEIYDDYETISGIAIISGYTNSTAQAYAETYGREFIALDGTPEETKPIESPSEETTAIELTPQETSYTTTSTYGIADKETTASELTTQETTYTTTMYEIATGETTTQESTTDTTNISTTASETTTTEAIMDPTETTITNIVSDEELCNWAINDYKSKNKPKGIVKAIINKSAGSQYEITLVDDSENLLDVYSIDPVTGIGTNSSDEEINLPQTGNNSLKNLLIAFGGLMAIAFGFLTVKSSGMIRRKKDEK